MAAGPGASEAFSTTCAVQIEECEGWSLSCGCTALCTVEVLWF